MFIHPHQLFNKYNKYVLVYKTFSVAPYRPRSVYVYKENIYKLYKSPGFKAEKYINKLRIPFGYVLFGGKNMTEPIPKWMQIKFSQLWQAFQGRKFTMAECQDVLQEKKREVVAVVLSRLKANGWLTVTPDPSDNRKKMYQLVRPDLILKQISVEVN